MGQTRLERIRKIFTEMQVIYDVRPEGYLLKFNSLLYDLLFMLIHSYSHKIIRKNFDREYKYLERLNEIMTYLKDHHREKVMLPELAERFGYNEDYLTVFSKSRPE